MGIALNKMITLLTILFFNTAPTVTITSHVTNQIVQSGEITIKATATDIDGISKVVFYVNTSQVGTDTRSPYNAIINLTPGRYTLKAKAYDKLGAYRTVSVTIDVRDLTGDFAKETQTITERINALEAELNKYKDSLSILSNYVFTPDTVIYEPFDKVQVSHDSPNKHRIKIIK